MRIARIVLALAAASVAPAGCGGGADTPTSATASSEEPELVLGDVQYLLGEAVAAHAAEDRATAERSWGDAVAKWRAELGPRVRARDARRALEIEYALGRLGDALRRPGGRPADVHKPLDKALRDLAPLLVEVKPDGAASDSPPP